MIPTSTQPAQVNATRRVVVIGAGPAGLSAAHDLVKAGFRVTVLERDGDYVGGIARTVKYKRWRFDLGGHRFFSKNPEIVAWWKARLGTEFISVRRLSRIFYRGRFFDYPLKPANALKGLGLFESAACVFSYIGARVRPIRPELSFADWVRNRFGSRLFRIFFKSYTEKVWGLPCDKISADWAAQRIKNLSLLVAIVSALGWRRRGVVKTLIESFEYPRLGPGMMWEHVRDEIVSLGGQVIMGANVHRFSVTGSRVVSVSYHDAVGRLQTVDSDEVIVSMPLSETVRALGASASEDVQEAARRLRYRDFITVALVVKGEGLFPDNWLYIHDPAVRVGRIQNFDNWSASLNEEPGTTCLGFEYFCTKGDELWSMGNDELIRLATDELRQLGLVEGKPVIDGDVVRTEQAYPVYDDSYRAAVQRIRAGISHLTNLQPVGRNGMHKYNNQDHSMMTGLIAARRLRGDARDPWRVNTDAEYQEEETENEAEEPRIRARVELN